MAGLVANYLPALVAAVMATLQVVVSIWNMIRYARMDNSREREPYVSDDDQFWDGGTQMAEVNWVDTYTALDAAVVSGVVTSFCFLLCWLGMPAVAWLFLLPSLALGGLATANWCMHRMCGLE